MAGRGRALSLQFVPDSFQEGTQGLVGLSQCPDPSSKEEGPGEHEFEPKFPKTLSGVGTPVTEDRR